MEFVLAGAAVLTACQAFNAGMAAMSDKFELNYICRIVPPISNHMVCSTLDLFPTPKNTPTSVTPANSVFVELYVFDRQGPARVLITAGAAPNSMFVIAGLIGEVKSAESIHIVAPGITLLVTTSGDVYSVEVKK